MKLIKEIPEGSMLPRMYGVAWRSFYPPYTVYCLPIPLSWVVYKLRSLYFRMRAPVDPVSNRELLSQLNSVGKQLQAAQRRLDEKRDEG